VYRSYLASWDLTKSKGTKQCEMKMMIANSRDKSSKTTTKTQYFGGTKVGDDVSASTQSMTEGDSESTESEPISPPQFPCFVTIENLQESIAFDTTCSYERKFNLKDNNSYQPDLDDSDDDSSFAPLEDDDDPTEADLNSLPDFTSQPDPPSTNVDIDSATAQPQVCSTDPQQTVDSDNLNEDNFVQPKTLPGLSSSHKMVCVSFLEPNVATAVACQVLDEAFRMLRPGGLLYVIDKGGNTVRKHPTMRQWLTRVRNPTVKHFIYEIETRAILQANGLGQTTLDENHKNDTWNNDDMVRWVGIKS
jgi:hypothetical protein